MGFLDILKKKQNKNYFNYVGELPEDFETEVKRMISLTPKFFKIKAKDEKSIAAEIYEIVDNILKTNKFPEEYSTIHDVAVALGIYYGQAICDYYNWTWKMLGKTNADEATVSIVSPNKNFSIQPMNYMLKILTNNNIGLDGKNDNTVLLLFNMLDNVDSKPAEKKYTPLS